MDENEDVHQGMWHQETLRLKVNDHLFVCVISPPDAYLGHLGED